MNEYRLELLPKAKKYLKSIRKEKQLIMALQKKIHAICVNPFNGEENKGDLLGTYSIDFKYQGSTYEIAYYIVDDTNTVIIILIGTRENFYEALKRYIRFSK